MPFSNPIVGGGGSLILKSIHSPNYVTGVSGWTINKDGTAEFTGVTIRGTLQSTNYVPLTSGWALNANGTADLPGASIRGTLQSSNYVANTAGWALAADGSADLNNVHVRGNVEVGSIGAGTLNSAIILGGGAKLAIGPNGSFIDQTGITFYNAPGSTVPTVNVDSTTGQATLTGNIQVVDGSGNSLAVMDTNGDISAQHAYITTDAYIQGLPIDGTASTSPNIPRVPGGYGTTGVGAGVIDSLPYGLVASGPFLLANAQLITPALSPWGVVSQSFQAEAGRMYEVVLSNMQLIASAATGYHEPIMQANLPASNGDQTTTIPNIGSGTTMGYDLHSNSGAITQHKCYSRFGPFSCTGAGGASATGNEIPFSGLVQFNITMTTVTSNVTYQQGVSTFPSVGHCDVFDIGPIIGATTGFIANRGVGTSITPTGNHTKTYVCSDSGTYDGSNNPIPSFGKEILQGYNQGTGGSWGTMSAMAIFPSMTADLTGATITGMSFTIHNHHWWFNGGGTVEVGYHGNTSMPGTFNLGDWPKVTQHMAVGATSTFAIDSSNWANFKSGTYRGLSFHAPSSSATYYGRFDGQGYSSPPKITVTYTK